METLDEAEQSMTAYKKANISIPTEIIEDIFSRLPVKSILRFRSLSKPWLSRLSSPSFIKLRPHRTALFISAYDQSTRKRHFLYASHDGGPVTHVMTLDDVDSDDTTEAQHLNGLVCFACVRLRSGYYDAQVFVVNPSTHKVFKLPQLDSDFSKYPLQKGCYLFGFDESKNEHKILIIRKSSHIMEIMIYSMLNNSWRKIYLEPPVGFEYWDSLAFENDYDFYNNACVNSVVHLMLIDTHDILGFDLRTEKFTIINTPQGVKPHEFDDYVNVPFMIKVKGCIGVVCYDLVLENNEIHIWTLQDYENRVWVKETITFPKSWVELGEPLPRESVNMDEVIFFVFKFSRNIEKSVSIYNKKSICFKDLQFTLGHQIPSSTTVEVNQIGYYVESMVPL
ncbi:putative F-box domain-containing protein [Helianthus debilis subsp. tardiflorus]